MDIRRCRRTEEHACARDVAAAPAARLEPSASPLSVKKYLSTIFMKIGAANRAEAVAIAFKRHLLKN